MEDKLKTISFRMFLLIILFLGSTTIASAQDSSISPQILNQFEHQFTPVENVISGLNINGLNKDYLRHDYASDPAYFVVTSSPYAEIIAKLHYLEKAYGFTESQALNELGFESLEEMTATVPYELIEIVHVGLDGKAESDDDFQIKSLMKMANGELSSRFYFTDGFTVLVQTLNNGTANGILKDIDSRPVRGYLISKNGEQFAYTYDAQGKVIFH